MGNTIQTTPALLIALGTKNVSGMTEYGNELKITFITAAQCKQNVDAYVQADSKFNGALSALNKTHAQQDPVMEALYKWLLGVSNSLAKPFGTRWNTQWRQAGFIHQSTGIPTTIDGRLALALALENFFTANPDEEVPSHKETAKEAANQRNAALAAQDLVTKAEIAVAAAGKARTAAEETLVAGIRSLLRNLTETLPRDDARWLAFGFNVPADRSTPGQPKNVTAQLAEDGGVLVTWDQVALAARYRMRRLIVGRETTYTLAGSVTDTMGMIKDVMAGDTVEIVVQAVNGRSQGVASDPIRITIPGPVEVSTNPTSAPRQPESMTSKPSSNGHTNGNRQPALRS